MKKLRLFAFISALCFIASSAYCRNNSPISRNELPQTAQNFISSYFPNDKVSSVKKDGAGYEVRFASNACVEFNSNGEWKEVDCQHARVPKGIVPAQINTYVTTKYPDAYIVEIKRDSRKFEVELSNNTELTFDKEYRLTNTNN